MARDIPGEKPSILWFSPKKYSPLTLRILLIVVFPTAMFFIGLLHLDQYRKTVLQSEIKALYRQGDTVARTIGLTDSEYSVQAQRRISELTLQRASQLIASIPDARIRIFQPDGRLINDSLQSSRLFTPNIKLTPRRDIMDRGFKAWLQRQLKATATAISPKDNYPLYREGVNLSAENFPAVVAALRGDAGSQVMRDRHGKLILGVAVPIRHLRVVRGALLVTASGEEVERDIEQVQIAFFQIFLAILVVTLVLGVYLSRSIVGPITSLARGANRIRLSPSQTPSSGACFASPRLLGRGDEIGTLARDLVAMTEELQSRMKATASFAADVSHEIKNPLTSLRSAVETMTRLKNKHQQHRLMAVILDDVARLDRLISDISAASRLDADLSTAEYTTVDLADLLRKFVDARKLTTLDSGVAVSAKEFARETLLVRVVVDRLVQVFDNIYANAVSFSPAGGQIDITLKQGVGEAEIIFADQGQGIPQSKLDTIFDRFYTERPLGEEFGRHSGLGLSISRRIIEAHGGSIIARNRAISKDGGGGGTGAELIITLPLTSEGD
jgi:two-component system sensor histidine kinase ChvG